MARCHASCHDDRVLAPSGAAQGGPMSMIKRRQLLKHGMVTTGGLLVLRGGGLARALVGARDDVPASNPTLPAASIPRYTRPLLIPSVMPQSRNFTGAGGKIDY